jgi:hypothetical protein
MGKIIETPFPIGNSPLEFDFERQKFE